MLRLLLRLGFLVGLTYSADHGLYRDCSRVPFCTEFRNLELSASAQFQASISELDDTNTDFAQIPLKNADGDQLNLQIFMLKNNKIRVKVLEVDHQRYELEDVLESEPEGLSYQVVDSSNDYVAFGAASESYKVVVNQGPPFTIQFYNGDSLQITLDGSRLVIQNGNVNDSVAFHFDAFFEGASALYGLHHHPTKLVLSETADGSMDPFRLRNSDTAGYEVGSPMALYGAIPIVYGHSVQQTAGLFLHNAAQQWVDISYADTSRPSAHFMAESGTFDVFVFLGPTTKEVVRQVTDLLGKAHMPQFWTLGYHQCRYSYQSIEDVESVITNMDQSNFPMDAIWLDIDYTDGKKYFTWNPDNFQDPQGMQEFIASTNRKLVTIIDCHIKVDDEYSVYAGAKGKYFVQTADGSGDFKGSCWPGESSWIDFLNPEARDYWVSLYSYDSFVGSTPTLAGTWNDMNEPALFSAGDSENSLPGDTLHVNGVKHRDVHNIYGFLQTKASHEALFQRDNGQIRPFVLTRSHFAGSQRYAAMWTGDNRAENPYLAITYSECMLSNILGHVFCGADIGGFEGNPPDNLLMRWYQAGIWIPFYRGHSNSNTNRREPYLFEEGTQNVIRNAMRLRYRHLWVFYTLFYQHTLTGDPIIRPLFYEYPGMLDYDGQILVGTDIMGVPVLQQDDTTVDATFPGDTTDVWYRADLDDWSVHYGDSKETLQADIQTTPYFYRGGSIVVLKDTEQPSSTDMLNDPFTVYVNLNSSGFSEGYFYDDDHYSFDYTNGEYFYLKLSSTGNQVTIDEANGNMDINFPIDKIVVHSVSSEDSRKSIVKSYTQTVEGTLLRNINFNEHLRSKNPRPVTLQLE